MDIGGSRCERFRARSFTFLLKVVYDWSFSLSSLLAYYLVLSLLPLLLSIFSITVLLFGGKSKLIELIRYRLIQAFPQEGIGEIVDSILLSMKTQAAGLFLLSFLVAIFGGSRLFIGMDDTLTIVYRIRERTILNQNIHAIKMLLVFIIFFPIIIITTSMTALFHTSEVVYTLLSNIVSFSCTFGLFMLIYYFVPARNMEFKKIWCGSLLASIALFILFLTFPLYVSLFMTNYVGSLGFIIVVLLLFYCTGLIFIVGAQINAHFFEDIQPLPSGVGNCLSTYIDHENIPLINTDSQTPNSDTTLIDGLDPYKRIS